MVAEADAAAVDGTGAELEHDDDVAAALAEHQQQPLVHADSHAAVGYAAGLKLPEHCQWAPADAVQCQSDSAASHHVELLAAA